MSESLRNFFDLWHMMMLYGTIALILVAIVVFVIYSIQLAQQKALKDKYEFASLNEIKRLSSMHIILAVALGMFLNTLVPELMEKGIVMFFVRLSISVIAATIYGYVASLMMKFYYPTRLAKKLEKLRYTPRINKNNGNQMRLLSEAEEDVYLDEGQQAEEDAFSIDYDVWIDEETGETRIEKYKGHLTALECDRCGFHTLQIEREEIVTAATEFEEGELIQHYKCSYCNRIKRQSKTIGKIGSSTEIPENPKFVDQIAGQSDVMHVHVEIHGSNGEVLNYEFQDTHQAETFLKEFDFSKVEH